jgi:molybdopterin-guanine dinucleotide biosynthesis adapter protein
MKAFGIAGWSGSGKTSLLEKLIPELVGRGLRVSTIKQAHLGFNLDSPGKDSWRHREAGAREALLSSPARWAQLHELRGAPQPTLAECLARFSPCDLVLVEGFKHETIDRLEVHRPAHGKRLLAATDPNIVAIASDGPVDGHGRPVLDLNEVSGIADFVLAHLRM